MSASAPSNSLVGRVVLGRYRILGHLSDGGMGTVYLARSEGAAGFVRAVVVKAVQPRLVGDPLMVELFVREARIMSNLRHPGIVSVIDFAEEQGTLFMVLEYVHGFHLGRWHKFMKKSGRRFPVDLACFIVGHILRALHYAHTVKTPDGKALQIVHRDVTPSNVLIDVEGHIKLADFGIARASTEHTVTGGQKTVKGKFPYLAPELFDDAEPSPATDLYSAAVMLHEVLVGTNELATKDLHNTVARVINHVPTRIDQARDDATAALADIVARALAKDPKQRYQSAADFADALASVRIGSEEELARKLSEQAAADFLDPRMADVLRLRQLQDLEAVWRTPISDQANLADLQQPLISVSRASADPPDVDIEIGERPTSAEPSIKLFGQPPTERRRRRTVLLAVGAALLLAGGVVGTLALAGKLGGSKEQAAYLVMEDNPNSTGEPPPPLPTPPLANPAGPDAGVTDTTVPGPAVRGKPPRSPGPSDVAARLTRTFGKNRGKLTVCFNQHAAEVSGTPELWVRIEVGADGRVTDATLVPASVGATQLGSCLIAVARATRFEALSEPVAFRVPIKARVK